MKFESIDGVMRAAPVIPVLVLDDLGSAIPIARTLVEAGLPVIEVTLRTPSALEIIGEMKTVPGATVGAGTVLNARQLELALEAGADFVVSPGFTNELGAAAVRSGVPFLPGIANSGDIMRGLELGLTRFKLFPAVASGGIPALAALASVFGDVRFCPTGGISEATAPEWLALPSVLCVGGSWIVPKGLSDMTAVEAVARRAAQLGQGLEV